MNLKTFLIFLSALIFPAACHAEAPPLQKICASDCAGPMASVTPWRDAQGKASIFEYRGDLRVCSHPPLVFFDAQAKAILTIPEVPLNPADPAQSARFKELHEKRTSLLKDLTRGKPEFCPSK